MYNQNAVLFVDDEYNILQAVRRALLDEEFLFFGAMSGQEAIELMERNKIDVIVTDMRMPEMNGLELLRVITERWPKTVKIVLTGYTQLTQIITTINQIDIFKFLTKPWQIDELITVVHKALDLNIMLEESVQYREKIENQNRTYQMLLRKFNDIISNSRFNTDFLEKCGKAMLDFGKDFDFEKQERTRRLFDIRGDLYEAFCKNISFETAELSAATLNEILSDYIVRINQNAMVSVLNGTDLKYQVRTPLLETTLYAIFEVFAEEFLAFGTRVFLGPSNNQKYSVLIQCPIGKLNETGVYYDPSILEVKLSFLSGFLKNALEMCGIEFLARIIDEDIVLCMNIESQEQKGKS